MVPTFTFERKVSFKASNGVPDVYKRQTYYCKFLTTDARKRGFSTFVWDNNHFGNGSEKYGIFDRFKSMKAVCLLYTSDVSVKAGFVNVKYFSTVFKKHFGVSPSKYL